MILVSSFLIFSISRLLFLFEGWRICCIRWLPRREDGRFGSLPLQSSISRIDRVTPSPARAREYGVEDRCRSFLLIRDSCCLSPLICLYSIRSAVGSSFSADVIVPRFSGFPCSIVGVVFPSRGSSVPRSFVLFFPTCFEDVFILF